MLIGIAALGGCTKGSGSTAKLCGALRGGRGFSTVFEGFDPTDAPAALDQLRTARVELGDLKDAAPGQVRDELQVEIDYVQALIDALVPLAEDADATKVAATVQAVTDAHPGVTRAAGTLQAFATEHCSTTPSST